MAEIWCSTYAGENCLLAVDRLSTLGKSAYKMKGFPRPLERRFRSILCCLAGEEAS